MVIRKDLLSMSFYKKSPYKGSDGLMRYMIEKFTVEEPVEEPEEAAEEKPIEKTVDQAEDKNSDSLAPGDYFKTTIWPGPYCFECTDDDKKRTHFTAFSEDGLNDAIEWLNSVSPEFQTHPEYGILDSN